MPYLLIVLGVERELKTLATASPGLILSCEDAQVGVKDKTVNLVLQFLPEVGQSNVEISVTERLQQANIPTTRLFGLQSRIAHEGIRKKAKAFNEGR